MSMPILARAWQVKANLKQTEVKLAFGDQRSVKYPRPESKKFRPRNWIITRSRSCILIAIKHCHKSSNQVFNYLKASTEAYKIFLV